MPLVPDDFRPATGLSNGHAQTFFAALMRKPQTPVLRREHVPTPDGDVIDVDRLDGEVGAPTVLLLHGLEGSSGSSYVRETLRLVAARRWNAWALNFRGCGTTPSSALASYSSGDTRDLAFLVARLPAPRFAIGFSLGASVLLNGLGRLDVPLDAAVAVSPPFRLEVSAKAIDSRTGVGPVYLRHFLPSLKRKGLEAARRFPHQLDADAIARVERIRDFDHLVTARAFGFSSAEDYYQQCSSAPVLAAIRRQTLIITADDDAIAPASALPLDAADNPSLFIQRTRHGGHVGYVEGPLLRPRYGAERRAVQWLESRLRQPARASGTLETP